MKAIQPGFSASPMDAGAFAVNQERVRNLISHSVELKKELKHEKSRLKQDDEDAVLQEGLSWTTSSHTFWEKVVSIRVINFVAYTLLLLLVVILLGTLGIISNRKTASDYYNKSEEQLNVCINSVNETTRKSVETSEAFLMKLGESLMTTSADLLQQSLVTYLSVVVDQQLATQRFISDFNIDVSRWTDVPSCAKPAESICWNWEGTPGMEFLNRHMYSMMKNESDVGRLDSSKGVVAYHLMDATTSQQQIQYLSEEYKKTPRVAYISYTVKPELAGKTWSCKLNNDGSVNEKATCRNNLELADSSTCATTKDCTCDRPNTWTNSTANFIDLKDKPIDPNPNADGLPKLKWSKEWIYQSGFWVNVSFPIYSKAKPTPVGVVNRVVSLQMMGKTVGKTLEKLEETIKTDATKICKSVIYVMNQEGELLAVSRGQNYHQTQTFTNNFEPYFLLSAIKPNNETEKGIDRIIHKSSIALLKKYNNDTSAIKDGEMVTYVSNAKDDCEELQNEEAPREYWVLPKKLHKEELGDLTWYIVVVISRAKLMYSVDRTFSATKTKLEKDLIATKADTKDKLEKSSYIALMSLIGVLIGIVVWMIFGMFVSAVIDYHIISPLALLITAMKNVAMMELDAVHELEHSYFAEIQRMQGCFYRMVNNLREMKAYMPDVLFAEEEDDESATEFGEHANENKERHRDLDQMDEEEQQQQQQPTGKPAPLARQNTYAKDMDEESNASQKKKTNRTKLALGLSLQHRKTSTCMVINMVNFNQLQKKGVPPKAIITVHSEYVQQMLTIIKGNKGVIDRFNGDKIFASWNTLVIQGDHQAMAMHAALQCKDALTIINNQLDHSGLQRISLRVGITSGATLSGNIGCDSLKGFSVLGTPVNMAYALEKLAKTNRTSILCDHECFQKAGFHFFTRKVDFIQVEDIAKTDPTKRPEFIYELIRAKAKGEIDEWMYELQEGKKNNPYDNFDKAFDAFKTGKVANLDNAINLIDTFMAANPNDPVAEYMKERIQKEKDKPTFTAKNQPFVNKIRGY